MATEFFENIAATGQARINPLMTRENLISGTIGIVVGIVIFKVFITTNVMLWSFGGIFIGGGVGFVMSLRAKGLSILERIYLNAHRRIVVATGNDYVLPHGESFYDAAALETAPTIEIALGNESDHLGVEFV